MTKKVSQIDGKFYQECDIIMLPVNKASVGCIGRHINTGKLRIMERQLDGNKVFEVGFDSSSSQYHPQHLYFLSDEEIKEGNWYYDVKLNRTYQSASGHNNKFYKEKPRYLKIIATTDELLTCNGVKREGESCTYNNNCKFSKCQLPRPSNEFIQAYCKSGGIDKVLVKMSEIRVYPGTESIEKEPYSDYQPKIASDNTIACKAIPEVFVQVNLTLLQSIIKYCEDQQIYDKLGNYDDFYYKLKALNKNRTA